RSPCSGRSRPRPSTSSTSGREAVERYDVVVVGAGPAGSLAARAAAEAGATTLLVDHRPELGHPVQCGEFVPAPHELSDIFGCSELVADAFDVPASTVLRETHRMACISPFGHVFRFPLAGCTVSRRAFDKALAFRAEGAGAELRFPLGVTGVHDDIVEASGGVRLHANVGLGAAQLPSGRSLGGLLDRFLSEQGLGPGRQKTAWWVPVGPPPESLVRGRALFAGDAAN